MKEGETEIYRNTHTHTNTEIHKHIEQWLQRGGGQHSEILLN